MLFQFGKTINSAIIRNRGKSLFENMISVSDAAAIANLLKEYDLKADKTYV